MVASELANHSTWRLGGRWSGGKGLLVVLAMVFVAGCSSDSDGDSGNGGNTQPITIDPTWTSCETSSDCALVEVGCCDHCNGGQLVSVNVDYQSQTAALKQTGCDACTLLGCSEKAAVCEQGTCGFESVVPVNCSTLDESACKAAPGCAALLGAPVADYCVDDLSSWMSVFAGCIPVSGCGAAETCATNEETGEKLVFPSTCIPDGWASTSGPACCENTGSPCDTLDQAECAAISTCSAVFASTPAQGCLNAPGDPEWVGCRPAETSCGSAETCGKHKGGTLRMFANTCLPAGWTAVDRSECCPLSVNDWTRCEVDDECVVREMGCCDHCNGGWLWALNSSHLDDADHFAETNCDGACTEIACGPVAASCSNGYCVWSDAAECAGKDEAGCTAEAGCAPIMGTAAEPVCAGNYDEWMSDFEGCHAASTGCDDAETCAIDPSDGSTVIFPSGCIPQGFAPTPCCPLTWYSSCGDPVCGPDSSTPDGVAPCGAGEEEGLSCSSDQKTCDAGLGCGAVLVCAAGDPKLAPGGCPISQRSAKTNIRYAGPPDLRAMHDELMRVPLATWQYRGSEQTRLGFVIDDVPGSPAVSPDGRMVDLYGFVTLAAAALQAQNQEIEALQARLNALEARCNTPPAQTATSGVISGAAAKPQAHD